MQRREFLKLTGAAAVTLANTGWAAGHLSGSGATDEPGTMGSFYVAHSGSDDNPGTLSSPFATLQRAQKAVRSASRGSAPLKVLVREGTYYLEDPLKFGTEDSGGKDATITYAAYAGENVTLSGGRQLACNWVSYKGGIMMTRLPAKLDFTQLFINGKRRIRARYPNYDVSEPGKSGYLKAAGAIPADAPSPIPGSNEDMTFSGQAARGIRFDPATFSKKHWAKPAEAEIHIFQAAYWGNLQWRIKAVDFESKSIWFGEGGQQIGAKWSDDPGVLNNRSRFFIDNVFEELDSPGEWYLDTQEGILYYYPEPGTDLQSALVEVPIHEHAIRFEGTQENPVQHIKLEGFRIAHTTSTYLSSYEVPSLSDWAIHRGGAVFAEGTRNCSIEDCWFDAVGGNGIFVDNYNRDFIVTGCKFTETGDSAVCFVGDLAKTTGTQRAFPYECQVTNNLIHDCGFFGKQIAGVYISRAKRITVGHNLIYNMPRAGICIGDSTWGGHIIEYNQTHDTVRETSDHGPFNSWGRDRAWSLAESHGPYTTERSVDAWDVLVDAMEVVIIRNNFFNEKSGWGLDLDDGASNYDIYNNISIGGVSMKLREGAYRKIHNNIWYLSKGAPCFHVGNDLNHDRYFNNITVMSPGNTRWPDGWPWWPQMTYSVIAPPANGPWFEEINHNCFYTIGGEFQAVVDQLRSEAGKRNAKKYNLAEWQGLGFDKDSVYGDPLFVDPASNDFRVRPESPALKVGFQNFEMRKWGLTEKFPSRWREPQST
ncbi:MAG: right-handed parallel beta-helix repeat-containing protein [Terriglobales bacterium]